MFRRRLKARRLDTRHRRFAPGNLRDEWNDGTAVAPGQVGAQRAAAAVRGGLIRVDAIAPHRRQCHAAAAVGRAPQLSPKRRTAQDAAAQTHQDELHAAGPDHAAGKAVAGGAAMVAEG